VETPSSTRHVLPAAVFPPSSWTGRRSGTTPAPSRREVGRCDPGILIDEGCGISSAHAGRLVIEANDADRYVDIFGKLKEMFRSSARRQRLYTVDTFSR
jgi:hypothetical protein